MQAKVKTARKKASRLHGAKATFVSLVDRGANETPFTIIKSHTSKNENGDNTMGIKRRKVADSKTKTTKSHKAIGSAKRDDKTPVLEKRMVSLSFSSDVYADEAAVEAALKNTDWEGELVITKNAKSGDFEVREDGLTDDDFEKIAKVDTPDKGVTAFIGMYAINEEDDDADEEEEEVQDSDTSEEEEEEEEEVQASEKVKPKKKALSKRSKYLKARKDASKLEKFDVWDAKYGGGDTISKVLEDGMSYDGVPPGVYEVTAAYGAVISNVLKSNDDHADKRTALAKAAVEVATIIADIDEYFETFLDQAEEVVAKVFKGDNLGHITKWADGHADFLNGDGFAPVAVKKNVDVAAPTIDYSKLAKAVSEEVGESIEAISDSVADMQRDVEALTNLSQVSKALGSDQVNHTSKDTEATQIAKKDKAFVDQRRDNAIFGG